MRNKLELTFFGNLEIRQGGDLLADFRSRKAQALLCYLAVTGQSHPRSNLAGLLWGGHPEDKARMNLSQALTTLRRFFREFLDINHQTIALRQGPGIWWDVDEFETRLIDSSADLGIPALQEAIQLYRGDFLNDFYVIKAPEFEEWVLTERVRLREMALRTLKILNEHFARKGKYDAALGYTRHLLAIEPWQEDAHRQLMQLLALTGRRSAALKQYEICRQLMLKELGVEPGAETIKLYERIREGEIVSSGAELKRSRKKSTEIQQPMLSGLSDHAGFSTNLPLISTPFVGRNQELADLDDLIINQGTRLVTLTGPGGIGKTRLALEFAERQLPANLPTAPIKDRESYPFPEGIFFVSLEALRTSDLILSAISEALLFQPDRGEAQLMAYLRSKRLLLIIDNFEHLLEGAEIFARILRSTRGVFILVTSRERLALHMEQAYPLRGLDYPESILTSKGAEYSAGMLFLKSARRQRPNFEIVESETNNLARICHLVEGLPLALELAATWVDTLPLSEIAAELQRGLDFLATQFKDLPARHRSMRAVVEVSWEQLTQPARNVFSQLSIFRGGFTREAAAAITGASIQDLSNLVNKSLLRYSPTEDRYYIHELLRQYGEEKLGGQSQELENLRNCHSKYYCEWFTSLLTSKVLRSVGQKTVLEAMTVELENVREAWTWGIKNQRLHRLVNGVEAFGMFFRWRGGPLEGERTFRVLIDCLSASGESMKKEGILLKASLLTWQAAFFFDLGKATKGNQKLKESRGLLDSPSLKGIDTRGARTHNLMESAFGTKYQSRQLQREHQAQVINLYREIEHPFALPYVLIRGGRVAVIAGRLDEAEDFFHQSLELYERIGNQIGMSRSLIGLGLVSIAHDSFLDAESFIQQAVRVVRDMEDRSRLTKVQVFLGPIYLYSGSFRQAQQVSEKCALTFAEFAYPMHQGMSMYYQAFSHLHLGEYRRAEEYGQEAFKFLQTTEEINAETLVLPEATSCMLSGSISLKKGDNMKALDLFRAAKESIDARHPDERIFGEDFVLFGLGTSLLRLDKVVEAQKNFFSQLQRALTTHRLSPLLYGSVGFALLLMVRGEAEQASDLYSLAAGHPFVGNSIWFSDISEPLFKKKKIECSAIEIHEQDIPRDNAELWEAADQLLLANAH